MKVAFVHLSEFIRDADRLGLDDDAVRELEMLIMERPDAGKVMAGTGGLRKVRFAPSASGKGKSGAIRVLYVYIIVVDLIFLVAAFGKNEKENINDSEKREYRGMIQQLRQIYHREQP